MRKCNKYVLFGVNADLMFWHLGDPREFSSSFTPRPSVEPFDYDYLWWSNPSPLYCIVMILHDDNCYDNCADEYGDNFFGKSPEDFCCRSLASKSQVSLDGAPFPYFSTSSSSPSSSAASSSGWKSHLNRIDDLVVSASKPSNQLLVLLVLSQ